MKKNNLQPIYSSYNRKSKFLGIIDYKSLSIICIYVFLVINLLKILPFISKVKISIFLFTVIPVICVFFVNIGSESTVDVLIDIVKFEICKTYFVNCEYIKDFKKIKFKYKKIN